MDPVTLFGVGMLVLDWMRKSADKRGMQPVQFSAIDVERFTGVEQWSPPGSLQPTGVRRFDPGICKPIAAILKTRSARPIEAQQLGPHVYEVVPYEQGVPNAYDVLDQASRQGLVVLGSLSLIYLLSGRDVPLLLVVGGPGTEALAVAGTNPETHGPAAHFARLYLPTKPTLETTATPVVERSDAVAAAPTEPAPPPADPLGVNQGLNGAAKHETTTDPIPPPELAKE